MQAQGVDNRHMMLQSLATIMTLDQTVTSIATENVWFGSDVLVYWAASRPSHENKEELFLFFVEQLTTTGTEQGKGVSGMGESILSNNEKNDIAEVAPCKHRELITGILYVVDATSIGHNK